MGGNDWEGAWDGKKGRRWTTEPSWDRTFTSTADSSAREDCRLQTGDVEVPQQHPRWNDLGPNHQEHHPNPDKRFT